MFNYYGNENHDATAYVKREVLAEIDLNKIKFVVMRFRLK
jgi:hypothetical protein